MSDLDTDNQANSIEANTNQDNCFRSKSGESCSMDDNDLVMNGLSCCSSPAPFRVCCYWHKSQKHATRRQSPNDEITVLLPLKPSPKELAACQLDTQTDLTEPFTK